MIPIDSRVAFDVILERLTVNWEAGKAEAGAPNARLLYPANQNPKVGPTEVWARVMRSVVLREPRTVGLHNNKVLHTEVGNILIQLFTPLQSPEMWQVGQNLAVLLRNSMVYPAANGAVVFRKAADRPQPDETAWRFWLIQAEYEFDESI